VSAVPGRELQSSFEQEPPAIVGANTRVGVRLLASSVIFLFMSFTFAFWYLKALNSNNLFHPKGVNPPQGWGIAILVCVLAATFVFRRARTELAANRDQFWRSSAIAGLALGVAVVVLQIIEYLGLSWQTASGGFASVFWGWTLVFLVCWLGAIYWMETLVAQTLRNGSADESSKVPVYAADGCVVFMYTLAFIEVLGYIFLYLVK
jgi:heme/copper-type cytochrome/quinol oxidase subunit 3